MSGNKVEEGGLHQSYMFASTNLLLLCLVQEGGGTHSLLVYIFSWPPLLRGVYLSKTHHLPQKKVRSP